MKSLFLILLIFFTGFSSSRLVTSHKSEKPCPEVTKVLVVGVSSNPTARRAFEKRLKKAFKAKEIDAVPSMYLSNPPLPVRSFSEHGIEKLKRDLTTRGFNSLLLTRVRSVDDRVTLGQAYVNFSRLYLDIGRKNSDEDFIHSYDEGQKKYKVFHTETALYSLTADHEEPVWRGTIDLVNPGGIKSSVKMYVRVLMKTLEEEKVLP